VYKNGAIFWLALYISHICSYKTKTISKYKYGDTKHIGNLKLVWLIENKSKQQNIRLAIKFYLTTPYVLVVSGSFLYKNYNYTLSTNLRFDTTAYHGDGTITKTKKCYGQIQQNKLFTTLINTYITTSKI